MGIHQQANALGGGIGLGGHGLDSGFGPEFDSWFGLAGLVSAMPRNSTSVTVGAWTISYSEGSMTDLMNSPEGEAIADDAESALAYSNNHRAADSSHNPIESAIVGTTDGARTSPILGEPGTEGRQGQIQPNKIVTAAKEQLTRGSTVSYILHTHIDAATVDGFRNAPTRLVDYLVHLKMCGELARGGLNAAGARMVVASPNAVYVATVNGHNLSANVLVVPWKPM
jgi:hypothetical protein